MKTYRTFHLNVTGVVLCIVLPLLAYGAGVAWHHAKHFEHEETIEIEGMAATLSVAVDAELDAARRLAEGLAAAVETVSMDPGTFHAYATRIVEQNPHIAVVVLTDWQARRHIAHSNLPPRADAPLSEKGEAEVSKMVSNGTSTIGSIRWAPTARQNIIPIWAPIKVGAQITRVVGVSVSSDRLNRLLARTPKSWTIAIIDPDDHIAGRNHSPELFVGQTVTESLLEKLHANTSGNFISLNKEGNQVFTVFARSPTTGWAVAIGVPLAEVRQERWHTTMVEMAALIAATLIAGALAGPFVWRLLKGWVVQGEVTKRLESAVRERTEQLAESESRFRLLFERGPQPMWLYDRDSLRFVDVNRAAMENYGYSRAEFLAMRITDIRPAEDIPRLHELLKSEQNTPRETDGWRHTLKNGRVIEVEVWSSPIDRPCQNLTLVVALDVTRRRQAERALAASEEKFRNLVSNIPGVVYQQVARASGPIAIPYVSAGVKEVFGYGPQEIVNNPSLWTRILLDSNQRYTARLTDSVVTVKPFYWAGQYRTKGGRERWIDIRGRPRRMENGDLLFDCIAFDVTDLVESQKALRESEERLRSIAFNIPGGIFRRILHPDGRVTIPFTSGPMARWLNRKETALAYDAADFIAAIHPDDRTRWSTAVKQSTRTLEPYDIEYRMADGAGGYRWIRAIAQTRRLESGEIVSDGVILDIDAQKKAEVAQKEAEGRLRRLAQNIPGMMFDRIQCPDGQVEYPSMFGKLVGEYGISPESHTNRDVAMTTMTHPDDREAWQKEYEVSARDMTVADNVRRLITPSGVRWFRSIAMPRRNGDGAIVWEGIGLDVTAQKEAEARLIQAEKLSTLGTMASGITHELNQPLSIIRMAADACLILMADSPLDPEHTKQQLETISGQCERMAGIINHMRMFSRRDDAGEATLFDPAASVRAAVQFLTEQVRLAGIGLSAQIPESCQTVRGRPVGLEQVVVNLIGNAKDIIEERHVSPGRIDVAVEEDADLAETRIAVTDNGGGIPADVLPKLFEPFFTTKVAGKGTGLGLAIVQSIVAAMGGTVAAANTTDGARFTVTLPWCRPS